MRALRSSFRRIARSFGRIAPLLAVSPAVTAQPDMELRPIRRKPRLTAAQRRALKLQGKYMGTMRGLKPGQRSKVKKIRVQKGIRAAIEAAEEMAS